MELDSVVSSPDNVDGSVNSPVEFDSVVSSPANVDGSVNSPAVVMFSQSFKDRIDKSTGTSVELSATPGSICSL